MFISGECIIHLRGMLLGTEGGKVTKCWKFHLQVENTPVGPLDCFGQGICLMLNSTFPHIKIKLIYSPSFKNYNQYILLKMLVNLPTFSLALKLVVMTGPEFAACDSCIVGSPGTLVFKTERLLLLHTVHLL